MGKAVRSRLECHVSAAKRLQNETWQLLGTVGVEGGSQTKPMGSHATQVHEQGPDARGSEKETRCVRNGMETERDTQNWERHATLRR